ncbi:hypothetical protein [Rubricoccus marinus]|uniref:Uncharacterized protein n=1 Tax=Rubricoccus marinus TaxID=716817 RepID=A0A259U1W7_9BACT|nr:hypothetical protein [Rubricoccus marinus]OZC04025.1 hypothetical protein BSZ36_14155 [Rubricoccus marinus]
MKNRVVVMLDLDARGVLKGTQAARTGVLSVGSAADTSQKRMGGLKKALVGLAAGYVSVQGAVNALRAGFRLLSESVKLAGIQQIADRRLEQSLKNLEPAALEAAGGLEAARRSLSDLAAETQDNSNFGDELITSAQSVLLSFKEAAGPEGAGLLTQGLVDLAAFAEKAGKPIGDLNQVAMLMGRALVSGAGALTEVGVSLTETQKAAFNSAEGLDKVRLLSEIIAANAGGLAEATVDEFRQMENAVGDLKEALGDGLRGVLGRLASKLTAIARDEGFVQMVRRTGTAIADAAKQAWVYVDQLLQVAKTALSLGRTLDRVGGGEGSSLGVFRMALEAALWSLLSLERWALRAQWAIEGLSKSWNKWTGDKAGFKEAHVSLTRINERLDELGDILGRGLVPELNLPEVTGLDEAEGEIGELEDSLNDLGESADAAGDSLGDAGGKASGAMREASDAAADYEEKLDGILVTASRLAASLDALKAKLGPLAAEKVGAAADKLRLDAAKAYVEAKREANALDLVNLGVIEGITLETELLGSEAERRAAAARNRVLVETDLAERIARQRVETERMADASERILDLAMRRQRRLSEGDPTGARDALRNGEENGALASGFEAVRGAGVGGVRQLPIEVDTRDADASLQRVILAIQSDLVASVDQAEAALQRLGEAYGAATSDEERRRLAGLADDVRALGDEFDAAAVAGHDWGASLAADIQLVSDQAQQAVAVVSEVTGLLAQHAANKAREADAEARESAQAVGEARREAERVGTDATEESIQASRNAVKEAEERAAGDAARAERAFEVQKAAALRTAKIDTALAILNALATTKPLVPAGLIAAGLAGAAGAVQIAAIGGQSYSAPKIPSASEASGASGSEASGTAGLYVAGQGAPPVGPNPNGYAGRGIQPGGTTVNVAAPNVASPEITVEVNGHGLDRLISEIRVREDQQARTRGSGAAGRMGSGGRPTSSAGL